MNDQNQRFLQKFLTLYQELLAHDGYGSMTINVRLLNGREKEVILSCGREYRFRIHPTLLRETGAVRLLPGKSGGKKVYTGPERRGGHKDRRQTQGSRRVRNDARHFRLERRLGGDRRNGRGRRHDD